MANFSPYSNFGYVALKKEATEGTPEIADTYIRVLSESFDPNLNIESVEEISWTREKNIRSVKATREPTGTVEFFVEPNRIGHFLSWIYGAPTTQTLTASVAFRHVFEVTDTPDSYTFEIKKANAGYAYRFYGVKITQLEFAPEDNKVKCTAELNPRKSFINSRLTTAVNSGTTITMDDTTGLLATDTIKVLDKADGNTSKQTFTIASVDSETQITVNETITASLEIDDQLVLSSKTESYDQDPVFTVYGSSEIAIGSDIDNTSITNIEEYTFTYTNEVENRYFVGKNDASLNPGDVITKGYMWECQLTKFYDTNANLDILRSNDGIWIRACMQGRTALESNSAVAASSTWGTGNGFSITASTAGKAGNDINVTITINTVDTLAASKSGNNVLIQLANTTAANNTGTLIAAAVDALSGVDSAAEWTGAEQFTTAEDNVNLGFRQGTSTDVVWRDANEKPYLQFDNADSRTQSYSIDASNDDIINEERPYTFYQDNESGDQEKKWSTRVFLINWVSSY